MSPAAAGLSAKALATLVADPSGPGGSSLASCRALHLLAMKSCLLGWLADCVWETPGNWIEVSAGADDSLLHVCCDTLLFLQALCYTSSTCGCPLQA